VTRRNLKRNRTTFRIKSHEIEKPATLKRPPQTPKTPQHRYVLDARCHARNYGHIPASSTQTQHTPLVITTRLQNPGPSGRQRQRLWNMPTAGCFQKPFLRSLLTNSSARHIGDGFGKNHLPGVYECHPNARSWSQ